MLFHATILQAPVIINTFIMILFMQTGIHVFYLFTQEGNQASLKVVLWSNLSSLMLNGVYHMEFHERIVSVQFQFQFIYFHFMFKKYCPSLPTNSKG